MPRPTGNEKGETRVRDADPSRAAELFDQANAQFERGLSAQPNEVDTLSILDSYTANELHRTHWFRRFGRDAEARTSAENALAMAKREIELTGKSSYNYACALAVVGNTEEALVALEAAAGDGALPAPEHLEVDLDLAVLRDHPRFKVLVEKHRQQSFA